MSQGSDPRTSVLAALGANIAIAIAQLVAAFVSGSTSMLAEAFHSVADTGNQALLGPDEFLVVAEVRFRDGLDTEEIARAVDRVEEAIRKAEPGAVRIFVEPEIRWRDEAASGRRPQA